MAAALFTYDVVGHLAAAGLQLTPGDVVGVSNGPRLADVVKSLIPARQQEHLGREVLTLATSAATAAPGCRVHLVAPEDLAIALAIPEEREPYWLRSVKADDDEDDVA